ncbi:unnamed protein product [Spirodela intermedia]|uniref:SRR1-like domain-containing protein n=1 Tax=Spirodela intermedia TaxID=51605 RepID=A0A7I8JI10_SPIIN|nr:unnamed protein product [Spirodela intermedia]CAA6669561.1 unnamed protein product [Spirodela intermedia]
MAESTAAIPFPDTETNPSAAGSWTVVSSRRRRRRRGGGRGEDADDSSHPSPSEAPNEALAPLPWSPADGDEEPMRISKLLGKLRSTMARLEASTFYRRFLSQLRDEPKVRDNLLKISPLPEPILIVLYGVGSIESYEPPRLQFSLALLLRREMRSSADAVEVFDPVLSAVECAAVEALGCRVARLDDRGRRRVDRPTLFYMPHCEAALYDNLLAANWGHPSFREYGRFAEEALGGRGSVHAAEKARYVLRARDFVEEISVAANLGLDEGNDSMFRAFNETSWHFFYPDRSEWQKSET